MTAPGPRAKVEFAASCAVWALVSSGACSSSSKGTAVATGGADGSVSAGLGSDGAGDSSTNPSSSGSGSSSSGASSSSASSSGASSSGGGVTDSGGTAAADRFPASAVIYKNISTAALDPNSASIISALAAAGWGSGRFQIDFSLTILHADPSVAPRAFTPAQGYYTPDCDLTPVPVPAGGHAEGATNYACNTSSGDCHVLVYQGTRLYELYNANIAGGTATGSPFTALCEVAWDLTRDYWQSGSNPYSRGDQCTSADAAGMPIAPLLATGAELSAGVVPHALRFTLPNSSIRSGVYLHPGTHLGGPSGGATMPAYTSRFRLKSTYAVSSLPSAGAKALATALQTYGMFLDDGGNIPLTIDSSAQPYVGSHDLGGLQVSDFEIVASADPAVTWTGQCSRTQLTN